MCDLKKLGLTSRMCTTVSVTTYCITICDACMVVSTFSFFCKLNNNVLKKNHQCLCMQRVCVCTEFYQTSRQKYKTERLFVNFSFYFPHFSSLAGNSN